MFKRAIGAAVLAALLGVSAGCGDGKPQTVPVGGKVMFNKTTPAAGALVVFHPSDPQVEKRLGGKPFAKVAEDGTFKLTTFVEGDGAPEGEYGITVDWRKKEDDKSKPKFQLGEGKGGGKPALKPQYSNPQAPFKTVTIKKGEANDFLLEVD